MKWNNSKRRVLLSTDWFPPAFKAGGPISSVHHLAASLARDYEVFVVTSVYDLNESQPLPVEFNTWMVKTLSGGDVRVLYAEPTAMTIGRWQSILNEVRPHVVHMNSMYSKPFTLNILRIRSRWPETRFILAPRGMLGQAALRIKPLKKKVFLQLAKILRWYDGLTWHVSSSAEKMEVMRWFSSASIQVAQNLPAPAPSANATRLHDTWNIVIIGRIHRVKNLNFGLSALLLSKSARPIVVRFIGPAEDAEYQRELENLADQQLDVKVEFLGGLPPDQLTPYFEQAHFLLSSTTQENFGHSIVEAWAHGCPVLISDQTPWRDLSRHRVGWDWPLDEKIWQEGLSKALQMAEQEWEEWSRASRQYFQDCVRNEAAERANLELFQP